MPYAAPLRSSASVALQLKNLGMLSLQYDYAHALREKESGYSPMNDIHTLRAGLEAQVSRGWYLNAGYVYESTFTPDGKVELAYNSIRTDTDYRFTQFSQYASAGFGYRNDHLVVGLAYQYGWQLLHQYATEHQSKATDVHTHTHRIVGTLAWRI
jgi:opacity protein-like surface antigen